VRRPVSTTLTRIFPILSWSKTYSRQDAAQDGLAAVIVTIMLIPQSLAYAMLAGMPPEAGLYASILPIIAYAIFGSSRVLAVGPVAVVSLMTAAALGSVAESGTADYATAALTLAALSGAMLFGMGLLRMGFIANFLSHPVIAGFITASAVLIAMGQIGPLIGVKMTGASLPELVESFWAGKAAFNWQTLVIGALGLAFLSWVRRRMKPTLRALGVGPMLADVLTNPAADEASIAVAGGGAGAGRCADQSRASCGSCRLNPRGLGIWVGCGGGGHSACSPATLHQPQLRSGTDPRTCDAGLFDLDRWLCRIRFGRADFGGAQTPAHSA